MHDYSVHGKMMALIKEHIRTLGRLFATKIFKSNSKDYKFR